MLLLIDSSPRQTQVSNVSKCCLLCARARRSFCRRVWACEAQVERRGGVRGAVRLGLHVAHGQGRAGEHLGRRARVAAKGEL
eukprot:5267763-Pleurochrysis_carterae.AAC.1